MEKKAGGTGDRWPDARVIRIRSRDNTRCVRSISLIAFVLGTVRAYTLLAS